MTMKGRTDGAMVTIDCLEFRGVPGERAFLDRVATIAAARGG